MLGTHVDALYDFTLGYANRYHFAFTTCSRAPPDASLDSPPPTPLRAMLGLSPKEVHLHIRRYPIAELPRDDEKLKQWIFQCWKEKDELLDHFKKHQCFPPAQVMRRPSACPSVHLLRYIPSKRKEKIADHALIIGLHPPN